MRIIAGQRRGHKIDGPRPESELRPTSDMVRESLFNILGELVEDRLVVDLFAGTGALGLEALSRGAARAIFVEKNRESVGLIHRNIATLRYQDRAVVRLADVYRWARGFVEASQAPLMVFLDPPYREYRLRHKAIVGLLEMLVARLPAGSVIVLEAGRDLDLDRLPQLGRWDVRRYGETRIGIQIVDAATVAPPEQGDGEPAVDPGAGGDRENDDG